MIFHFKDEYMDGKVATNMYLPFLCGDDEYERGGRLMSEHKSKEKTSTWISIYTNHGRCDLTVNVPIEDMKKNISGVLENSEKFFRATDYKGNTYIFPIDSIDHIELYQVQKREV